MPIKRKNKSARLFKKAQQVLPGGVNSPVRAFKAVGSGPLFIRSAHGSHIQDVDGQKYIDYVMSWGPLIHGHAPPGLVRSLNAVARRGTSFGAPISIEVELGMYVQDLMPTIEQIRFVSSGTEATMSAVRLARAATAKNKIIKFAGCYHGHSDAFLVQAGSGATTYGVPTSPGVSLSTSADTLVASYNDIDSVRRLCKNYRDEIAAVIVEPVAGNMGVIPPSSSFLQDLREVCNRNKFLLIFDEVISGFRVAAGGAQTLIGVRPDLTCLGKILGGGLPAGAFGGRLSLMKQIAPSGPVYQAGTLSGNPLTMTAGLWNLRHLSSALYRRLDRLGTKLTEGLTDASREASVPLQVNSFGSILTPFFTETPVYDYRSALTADTNSYAKFFREMLVRGVYLPPSQFEAWFLSGAHTERDVDKTIRAARDSMKLVGRVRRSS